MDCDTKCFLKILFSDISESKAVAFYGCIELSTFFLKIWSIIVFITSVAL